jgi:hypothetical protein
MKDLIIFLWVVVCFAVLAVDNDCQKRNLIGTDSKGTETLGRLREGGVLNSLFRVCR